MENRKYTKYKYIYILYLQNPYFVDVNLFTNNNLDCLKNIYRLTHT